MVELWLAGPAGEAVELSLSAVGGPAYAAQATLREDEGGYYRFDFPAINDSAGGVFQLTLAAPQATAEHPVVTRVVGGDRLGGTLRLNEFNRAGNLELYSYARGLPGRWWVAAVGEQLLPALFRLRLEQYKPPLFKGSVFSGLLLLLLGLTFGFLVLSRSAGSFNGALAWSLLTFVAIFLIWQVGSGRVRLPLLTQTASLATTEHGLAIAPPPDVPSRIIHDLSLSLWTAERLPQARLVTSELHAGLPAIQVPADAELGYSLSLPPGSQLSLGFAAVGEGRLAATVLFGEQVLLQTTAVATTDGERVEWFLVDLAELGGQTGTLRLLTDSDGVLPVVAHSEPALGAPEGRWVMAQIATAADWLFPDPPPEGLVMEAVAYQFGGVVELVGYTIDPPQPRRGEVAFITLYWRLSSELSGEYAALQPLYPTVFVHLLDPQHQILAQHDAPPLGGAYPVADWQPGVIIADRHELLIPAGGTLEGALIAVGLYDPVDLARWPAMDDNGIVQPDGRALLPIE
jgi:hypothetical protein